MKLTSPDFEDGGDLAEKFTCNGEGLRPSLVWSEIPTEAKTLAISLVDPDAPSGNFIHWLVINIPISTTGIASDEVIGDELPNTTGDIKYVPPCPPTGKHHYIFTIYALNIDHLEPKAVSVFSQSIKPHIINQATTTGLYGKI